MTRGHTSAPDATNDSRSEENRKLHEDNHDRKKFECSEYGNKLATAQGLRTHMKLHTMTEKPFKCEHCSSGVSDGGHVQAARKEISRNTAGVSDMRSVYQRFDRITQEAHVEYPWGEIPVQV